MLAYAYVKMHSTAQCVSATLTVLDRSEKVIMLEGRVITVMLHQFCRMTQEGQGRPVTWGNTRSPLT